MHYSVHSIDKRVWELMQDVPEMRPLFAYVCLVLNIIIAGLGTIVSGALLDKRLNKT